MNSKTENQIRKTLKRDARALEIPAGAAEIFIDRTIKSASKSLTTKKIVTEDDITRAIYKELKKYHKDLAYVYKNRGTII